jgi:23S rRNA pseudouridine1911/1915/1917 synthase
VEKLKTAQIDEWSDIEEEGAAPLPVTQCVGMSEVGQRLDKVAAKLFPDYSRSRLQTWIEEGHLLVDGQPATIKTVLRGAEILSLQAQPDPSELAFLPEAVPFEVLADDPAVIVVNKAAGLVVHPAAGNWQGTLLNGLLHRYPEVVSVPRAGIVHRLDKETSGVMVVARSLIAQTDLVRQLQARTMKREYRALVWGDVQQAGTVTQPLGRHPQDRLRMAVVATGKPATTHYTPLAQGELAGQTVTWVKCQLETGRTHQIRVHLQFLGHPLVGDPVYGKVLAATPGSTATKLKIPTVLPVSFARQALHATDLQFAHPTDGYSVSYHAPLPDDLRTLLAAAGIAIPPSA